MPWALLDDSFPHHPKVMSAGPVAAFLYVCGLCYCRKYHTDGFIPSSAVKTLGVTTNPKRLVEALISVGLWELAANGYRVHDYAAMYDDAEAKDRSDERRQQKREAGRKGGLASWQKRSASASASSTTEAETKQPASTSAEAHRVGVGIGGGSGSSLLEERTVVRVESAFAAFQEAYPASRRKGGYLASSAFFEAVNGGRTTVADIMAALENHKRSAQWQNPKLIPGMDVWLREERWVQRLDPPAVVGISARTAGNAAAVRAFVEGR